MRTADLPYRQILLTDLISMFYRPIRFDASLRIQNIDKGAWAEPLINYVIM